MDHGIMSTLQYKPQNFGDIWSTIIVRYHEGSGRILYQYLYNMEKDTQGRGYEYKGEVFEMKITTCIFKRFKLFPQMLSELYSLDTRIFSFLCWAYNSVFLAALSYF